MRKQLLLTLSLSLVLLPSVALAKRVSPLEGQPAVRHRMELRQGRFELGPSVNMTLNRYVRNEFLVGARLAYHITDWFSLGADIGYGIGADTALAGELKSQYEDSNESAKYEKLHNRFSDIQLAGDVRANFTPLSGKLGLFSKLFVHYDTYIFAGFGFALLKNGGSGSPADFGTNCSGNEVRPGCVVPEDDIDAATKGFRPGAAFGVGFHLFFNDFIALGVELKDMLFSDNESGGDTTRGQTDTERNSNAAKNNVSPYLINADDRKFSNHFFAGLNITFYLPPTAKISR